MSSIDFLKKIEEYSQRPIVYCETAIKCPLCLSHSTNGPFSDKPGIRLKSCLHEICRNCLFHHVVGKTKNPEILCPLPECSFPILESEILAVSSKDIIDRLHHISVEHALQNDSKNVTMLTSANIIPADILNSDTMKALTNVYTQSIVICSNRISCPICFEDIEANVFKSNRGIRLRSCLHEFCEQCLKEYARSYAEPDIKCPIQNCSGSVAECELRAICTPEVMARLHRLSVMKAELLPGQSRLQCFSVNCSGMVIYDGDIKEGLNFKCLQCNKVNCVTCQAQHEGETCSQYRSPVESCHDRKCWEATVKDAEQRINKGLAMLCPRCKVLIEKVEGCNALVCTMCKFKFRWTRQGPIY
ncbi:hypothetical protein GJ496_007001 [Pomphorhynchus laevis]|nr:hypothetical protein GJ496_007001 [Pomphorhynchus laevis]